MILLLLVCGLGLWTLRKLVQLYFRVKYEKEMPCVDESSEFAQEFLAGRQASLAKHRKELSHDPNRLLSWLWLADTSSEHLEVAERRLLLHFLGDPAGYHTTLVPCTPTSKASSESNQLATLMNTLVMLPTGSGHSPAVDRLRPNDDEETPLVIAHGFGGAVGIFVKTLQSLRPKTSRRIYAFDWLGMGRSSRPAWLEPGMQAHLAALLHALRLRTPPAGEDDERRVYAEQFFVEALEAWRRSTGLKKMVLIGHSIGGYLSAVYALRYPEAVERLILVSPCGTTPVPVGDQQANRRLYRWVRWVWQARIPPQSLLRLMGPWGRHVIWRVVQWRGLNFEEGNELRIFADYLYHVTVARSSGENCLYSLLERGAYARASLDQRLAQLPESLRVDFVYGTYDWMDKIGAKELCNRLPNRFHYHTVTGGHHLYLDEPEEFAEMIVKLLNTSPKCVHCLHR